MSTAERSLLEPLGRLRGASPDVHGAAIAASDGRILAADLDPGLEPAALTAAAALASAADALSAALWERPARLDVLRSDAGHAVVARLTGGAALVVVAGPGAQLGMLLLEVEARAPEIARALGD